MAERRWPKIWLTRPTPVADAENYEVWGPADNPDLIPHPVDGESCRYVPEAALAKARKEGREEVREQLKAARRDTNGVPFLDAARALCPDEAHWDGEGWRRYADDASACLDAFLDSLTKEGDSDD